MVVITGCAHPGIVKIIEHTKGRIKDNVLLAMGGFHLFWHRKQKIRAVISRLKELGVRYVGPCHCSGKAARKLFENEFQDHYLKLGVGRIITVTDLK